MIETNIQAVIQVLSLRLESSGLHRSFQGHGPNKAPQVRVCRDQLEPSRADVWLNVSETWLFLFLKACWQREVSAIVFYSRRLNNHQERSFGSSWFACITSPPGTESKTDRRKRCGATGKSVQVPHVTLSSHLVAVGASR